MANLMQLLGETLHTKRRRKDITLRALEDKTKVSYAIISRVEKGTRPQASFEVIARLAHALDVSLDEVLHRAYMDEEQNGDWEKAPPKRSRRRQGAAEAASDEEAVAAPARVAGKR
jgi:transcriptional regulator with XRE-family HTH domain